MHFDLNKMGVSLRDSHFSFYEQNKNSFNAIEIVSENYLFAGLLKRQKLVSISKDRFIHMHGVSGNIGSFDDLDLGYYKNLADLSQELSAQLISDHLCYTRANQQSSFELLPVPMTKNMIHHIGQRIKKIEDIIGQKFLLENISHYFRFEINELSEAQFIHELYYQYDIHFLLDINNVYVSSQNLQFCPFDYIRQLPEEAIKAYHLGGFEEISGFCFDTHGAAVSSHVKKLYKYAVQKFGFKPVFLERDENLPVLLSELENELREIITL